MLHVCDRAQAQPAGKMPHPLNSELLMWCQTHNDRHANGGNLNQHCLLLAGDIKGLLCDRAK